MQAKKKPAEAGSYELYLITSRDNRRDYHYAIVGCENVATIEVKETLAFRFTLAPCAVFRILVQFETMGNPTQRRGHKVISRIRRCAIVPSIHVIQFTVSHVGCALLKEKGRGLSTAPIEPN